MLRYSTLLICCLCSCMLFSQGVNEPGKYSPVSKVESCYKTFYKKPERLDTLSLPKGAVSYRIWRIIDLKDPAVKTLFTRSRGCENVALFDILKFGVLSGMVNAFDNDVFDGNLKHRMDIQNVKNLLLLTDTVDEKVFDAEGNETSQRVIKTKEMGSENLAGFLICEDWYFDTHWSKLDKRMISISPIAKDQKTLKEKPLFYLYFNECRDLLGSFRAATSTVDEPVSYDEFFLRHKYPSFVVKKNNIFNRSINEYKKGQDAEMEHDETLKKLHSTESDLFDH